MRSFLLLDHHVVVSALAVSLTVASAGSAVRLAPAVPVAPAVSAEAALTAVPASACWPSALASWLSWQLPAQLAAAPQQAAAHQLASMTCHQPAE